MTDEYPILADESIQDQAYFAYILSNAGRIENANDASAYYGNLPAYQSYYASWYSFDQPGIDDAEWAQFRLSLTTASAV